MQSQDGHTALHERTLLANQLVGVFDRLGPDKKVCPDYVSYLNRQAPKCAQGKSRSSMKSIRL